MTEPIAFPTSTPAIGLPLLFAGQTQKEFFVNQAFSLLDAAILRGVIATLDLPPPAASDGDCYIVANPASGEWGGRADSLAIFIAGAWHFIAPVEGMQVFDRSVGHWLTFRSNWQVPASPQAPEGGSVVDVEVRAAFAELIGTLRSAGLIADSPP